MYGFAQDTFFSRTEASQAQEHVKHHHHHLTIKFPCCRKLILWFGTPVRGVGLGVTQYKVQLLSLISFFHQFLHAHFVFQE